LPDRERPAKNAHVEVDTTEDDILDAVFLQKAPSFLAVPAEPINLGNKHQKARREPPDLVLLFLQRSRPSRLRRYEVNAKTFQLFRKALITRHPENQSVEDRSNAKLSIVGHLLSCDSRRFISV
jgi:hypothetical protein